MVRYVGFRNLVLFLLAPVFLSKNVLAHGPTPDASAFLGISNAAVFLFVGAFAMFIGMWLVKFVEKKYVPFQKTLIITSVFVFLFLLLLPIFNSLGPIYFSFLGEYGTTFLFDYSLLSGLFGGLMIFLAPSASQKITKMRNGKNISFQIIILSVVSLLIVGTGIQFLI